MVTYDGANKNQIKSKGVGAYPSAKKEIKWLALKFFIKPIQSCSSGKITRTLPSVDPTSGGIRGGGSRNFGPCCEEVDEDEEGEDDVEGLRVNKGFRPANKWVTGLIPDDVDEKAALAGLSEEDPFRSLLDALDATVQNMTCACF